MNDKKLNEVMHKGLDKEETSITFEQVWSSSERLEQKRNKIRRQRRWPIILVASLIIIMGSVVGAQQFFRIDDISYEFKEDKEVLGTWVVVDFVNEKSDFVPGKRQWLDDLHYEAILFKPKGVVTMIYRRLKEEKPFAESTIDKWTRGSIINLQNQTKSHYWIEEIENEEYLFCEWKSGDYTYRRLEKPYIYVYKRGELNEIQQNAVENEGKIVNTDDTNIEFENAEDMLGTWQVVDFVSQIEEFDESHTMMDFDSKEFLSEIIIKEKGRLEIVNKGGMRSDEGIKWSGHQIIHQNDKTVSQCLIKVINGKTYMFYEWKSGDYIYRDQQPSYFVLIKK